MERPTRRRTLLAAPGIRGGAATATCSRAAWGAASSSTVDGDNSGGKGGAAVKLDMDPNVRYMMDAKGGIPEHGQVYG